MNHRSRVALAGVAGLLLAVLGVSVPIESALAFHEPNPIPGYDVSSCDFCHPGPSGIPGTGCWACHNVHSSATPYYESTGACVDCHSSPDSAAGTPGYVRNEWSGPHGGYLSTTDKCSVCHSVHDAPASGVILLPGATVTDTCFSCHDGTGGFGVYGTIKKRTGIDPEDRDSGQGGAHRVRGDVTFQVPGGDPGGGMAPADFSGPGDVLACNDCHSPHGSSMVDPFLGDRRRVRGSVPAPVTSRLLKRMPTSGTAEVTVYGSDWCLACHKGRDSGGMGTLNNHPVDTNADGRTYSLVAILDSDAPTGVTEPGPLGGIPYTADNAHWPDQADNSGNRGFLMPFPRTAEQKDHGPICQQCHEDSRFVGELVADGAQGDAAAASIDMADQVTRSGAAWVVSATDNPAFQNFPHETLGHSLLVEAEPTHYTDTLCTNCHPMAQLD